MQFVQVQMKQSVPRFINGCGNPLFYPPVLDCLLLESTAPVILIRMHPKVGDRHLLRNHVPPNNTY